MLREDVADWFDLNSDSPYMLIVADLKNGHRRQMSAEEQTLSASTS
jgi:carbamoyltransferase